MSEPAAQQPEGQEGGIRIILDWIEIIDSMDLDGVGEFRFLCRVKSDRRGILHDTRLPEHGTISIPEDAARNHLGPLDLVLFEGPVEPGEAVTLEITGEEVDLLSPNDPLEYYERTFTGEPESWFGTYSPWDEGGDDPENRAQWRLSYRVEARTPMPESTEQTASPLA